MRTIIRFSVNQDPGSPLRNTLAGALFGAGLRLVSTATYEGNPSEDQIRIALNTFWTTLSSWTGTATLDHFWMYSDNPKTIGSPAVADDKQEAGALDVEVSEESKG